MLNLKGLCVWLATISLLFVAIGLIQFAVVEWHHYQMNGHIDSNSASTLNSSGLGMALGGAIMFALFFLVYRLRRF